MLITDLSLPLEHRLYKSTFFLFWFFMHIVSRTVADVNKRLLNENTNERHCPTLNFSIAPCCVLGSFSHVQLCATLLTVAHQAPLSMEFSREEYWSGLPCLPPRDLLDPGIELASKSPALAGRFFTTRATCEAPSITACHFLNKVQASSQRFWMLTDLSPTLVPIIQT